MCEAIPYEVHAKPGSDCEVGELRRVFGCHCKAVVPISVINVAGIGCREPHCATT